MRLSLFAGERFTWKTCEIWKRIAPNSRMANLYGSTVATIVVFADDIPLNANGQMYRAAINARVLTGSFSQVTPVG